MSLLLDSNQGKSGATFDRSGRYRYRLWRQWDSALPTVAYIMLNPSTADETANDPTMRACIRIAKLSGFGGMEVVNLFAYRTPDPRRLKQIRNPR